MKKLILPLCFALLEMGNVFGQSYDDGYVTNGLPVNVNTENYSSFVNGFEDGLAKVAKGEITTNEQLVANYGYDLLSFTKLDDMAATGNWTAYGDQFSEGFLRNLQSIFSKVGSDYNSIYAVRTALKTMPGFSSLSTYEAQALAGIDIAIQEVNKKFLTSFSAASFPAQIFSDGGTMTAFNSFNSTSANGGSFILTDAPKLPGWARCVLGIISEGVIGALAGGKIGTAIGGAIGGAVGGIIGGAAGVINGATRYC
jgi:hypothetical protein